MVDIDEKEILYNLVKTEAENLKIHATEKELSRLIFEEITPHKRTKCIYGQLTGNCISERAEELIIKCCTKVYKSNGGYIMSSELIDFPKDEMRFFLEFNFFSPIEKFLYVSDANEKSKLIDYLKGHTKTLNFI